MNYEGHNFIFSTKRVGNEEIEYGKCTYCNVIYLKDRESPYFNMACSANREREKLRNALKG